MSRMLPALFRLLSSSPVFPEPLTSGPAPQQGRARSAEWCRSAWGVPTFSLGPMPLPLPTAVGGGGGGGPSPRGRPPPPPGGGGGGGGGCPPHPRPPPPPPPPPPPSEVE